MHWPCEVSARATGCWLLAAPQLYGLTWKLDSGGSPGDAIKAIARTADLA
jgi:hypothetical protein